MRLWPAVDAVCSSLIDDATLRLVCAGGTLGIACSQNTKSSGTRLMEHDLRGADALAWAVGSLLGLSPTLQYIFRNRDLIADDFEIEGRRSSAARHSHSLWHLRVAGYKIPAIRYRFAHAQAHSMIGRLA